jgi:hypothetical protein
LQTASGAVGERWQCAFNQSVETVSLIADSIGSSRGEVAMRLLLEMNHEVRGDFVEETVEQVCRVTNFSKFHFFTLL